MRQDHKQTVGLPLLRCNWIQHGVMIGVILRCVARRANSLYVIIRHRLDMYHVT